jgi:hypothetical protein
MNKLWQNKTIWVSTVALFFLLALSLFLCSRDTRVTLDEFVGVWNTTAINYEDRFFKISDSTIAFGIGDGKQDIYYIQAVTQTLEDKKHLYTISYENIEKTDFKLSFYYDRDAGGVIRFKNQMDIEWTRDK